MFNCIKTTARILTLLLMAAALPHSLLAAGPAPVNLRSTAPFVILAGAAITSTGGGLIKGNVGASPIAGSAIGVTCAQVIGIIYAVDASGPPCAIIDASLLTTAKGDLTTAYNDAAGRTPTPTGPNLNPGLIPGSGNIGGMTLAPGLYKFTTTAMITGSDVTLMGSADDVWIFQCAQDLQLGSGIKVILAGGAQAKNVFWQVGTSAVLGTSSSFKGTILADQAITFNTSSTFEGRALAFSAGVVFNGSSGSLPTSPEIAVEQPLGANIPDGGSKDFGSVVVGGNNSLIFTIKNTGDADLTGLGILIDGVDSSQFSVTSNPVAPVSGPLGVTTFTVRFAPTTSGLKTAALHIANNDSDENPFDIALTGVATAIPVPEIAVEQPLGVDIADGGSKDFGSAIVGGGNSLVFAIKNTGSADLTGLGITIDGLNSNQFTVTANPIAPVSGPLGSTTFTVRFAPTTAGLKVAALHIANNDSDENPFDIALTGLGSAVPAPEISVEQPVAVDLADGGSKDFGTVAIAANTSLVFTIRNTGSADLTGLGIAIDGLNANQFTVTANPIAPVSGPLGSTTFTVRFAPTTAGLKVAALHIANNDSDENPFDIALTGTGTAIPAPEIVVEQPVGVNIADGGSKDFGSIIASGNTSLVFTIKNTGTADLTVGAITIDGADASFFTVTANPTSPVGGPSGGTTFTLRFAPGTVGPKTAALHIANNDSDENPFDITLTGTGTAIPAPEIVVEQPLGVNIADGGNKDFGSVVAGGSASLVFSIKNIGNADLALGAITIDGADAASFTVTANPTSPVGGPSGGTTFTVRFAPVATGLKVAGLHLANNDSDENPFDIALTGTGTAVPAPEIVVEQPLGVNVADGGSKNFGSVVSGGNASLVFTIKNTGNANLTLGAITIDGADASSFTVTANPTSPVGGPSGGTTFTVRFAPVATGSKVAALHLANNDSDESPFDITLSGTATAIPTPEIVVEQPLGVNLADGGTKDLGSVVAGSSASMVFSIKNIGNADLTLGVITIDGADASSFSVTANPTSPVGGPSGGTTFTVRFAPVTTGAKVAALHLANNDSDENPFDITLTGTATPVPAPEIVVEQPLGVNLADGSGRNFGSVLAGSNGSLVFTIKNIGNADLTVGAITIDGPDASLFTVTANPTSPVGGPSGGTTFTVRFAPPTPGLKVAALHIANNDSDENPFDMSLTGTGTTPEISVEQPLGIDIADGGSKDFGTVTVTFETSLVFTIRNNGNADLTGLGILIDGADATQFTVTANPAAAVGLGDSTSFTVRFAPTSAGPKSAALHIANNDSDENPFDIALSGTGVGGLFIASVSPITLNPQTGLFEQTVGVINRSVVDSTASRLQISGLPADVQVYNRSGFTNGIPFVQFNHTIAAGATVNMVLEYYRASRATFATPAFEAVDATPVTVTPAGTIIAIDRNVQLASGRFLIEFSTTAGRTYAIQYSSNLTTWITVNPSVVAPANRVQWYDDGPPKTESKPTAGNRFYRVIELP